jgi:hypothetical protein
MVGLDGWLVRSLAQFSVFFFTLILSLPFSFLCFLFPCFGSGGLSIYQAFLFQFSDDETASQYNQITIFRTMMHNFLYSKQFSTTNHIVTISHLLPTISSLSVNLDHITWDSS